MHDLQAFVRSQLAPLALPPGHEQKIVEEWGAQLEEAYEALVAGGRSGDEAWAELQRQLPDWTALGRELLDAEPVLLRLANPRHAPWPGMAKQTFVTRAQELLTRGLMRDLRGAVRLFFTDRGYSATVVLTLAICLGANAAVFTVVQSVLLRPLPFPGADRVVAMGDVYPTVTPNDILANDAPSYFDRLTAVTALEEQALFSYWFDTVAIDGVPQEVRGMRATPSLFRLLQVAPALGRVFTDAEGQIGADRKVILSHGLWQQLYGGHPSAIGSELRLGWTGQSYTIVGVMPRGFTFFDTGSDGHARPAGETVQFYLPLAFTPAQMTDSARTRYQYFHLGRLRPGATVEQVRAQIDAVNAANFKRLPQFGFAELGVYTAVTPLQEALTRNVRRLLYLLLGGAGFVLLIGAINIASLALARAQARTRELATRLALGARRLQLTRQLIIEGLVPALAGGVAGAAVGVLMLRSLASDGLAQLPNAARVQMDAVVIVAIGAASALVGVVIGAVSAMTIGRHRLDHALADRSRTATGGRASRLFRRGLVVAQVALSVVLLIGATLLLTSVRHLLAVDAGFTPDRVVTATIFPPPSRYANPQAVTALSARVLDAVRAIPGVEAAGMTSNVALSGRTSPSTVADAGRPPSPGDPPLIPSVVAVTPGYFEAMKTRLIRGRFFDAGDREDSQRVAIVDERLAAWLWPNQDPIGKGIVRGQSPRYDVVGVVANIHLGDMAGQAESVGAAYFPDAQAPPLGRLRWIVVKATAEPAPLIDAVRSVLVRIDPDLPLSDIQTMTERMSRSLGSERLAMRLTTLFGLVALFLSMLGIYGVLASAVARRTREIGVRMALGSTMGGIFHLVFREGVALIGIGLVLGVGGALALSRTLQGQLFGVRPTDPLVLGSVALATGLVALLACVAPALRAARVDPVRVL